MRRAVLPLLILAAIAVAGVLAWAVVFGSSRGDPVEADAATQTRDLKPFTRIEIDGNAQVSLEQGARETIAYVDTGDARPRVRTRVDGDTRYVIASDRRRWWDFFVPGRRASGSPRITITFVKLEALALAGAVDLRAGRIETPQLLIAASGGSSVRIDDLQSPSLRVAGSGALSAHLAGAVTDANFSIAGAGQVQADKLKAVNASVSVSGVGNVVLSVEKTLRASISGAGSIEYYGNPEVKKSVSGMGSVKRREAEARRHFEVAVSDTPTDPSAWCRA